MVTDSKSGNPTVVLETTLGTITVELFRDKAPASVDNFLGYVTEGFYDGTVFHRVIKDFMIQGGGITAQRQRKATRPPIANEATNGLKNVRGSLAMARTSEVASATSQFFINARDNAFLDHKSTSAAEFGYAVFGRVTAGMDVVDKIERVPTRAGDEPATPVVIEKAFVK
jgi:cyclophilin family peptidyl-prolyl cis-trans isomerase